MEEAGTGKITRKFVIKFILFFILIDIVIGGVIFLSSVSKLADAKDPIEMVKGINGAIRFLMLINVVAAIVPGIL